MICFLLLASCSKASIDTVDLAAKITGTYEGSFISGTSNYVTTQVKLTKIDALTIKVEHLNPTPAFDTFNLPLEEISNAEIRGDLNPWLGVWTSNVGAEKIALKNQLTGATFSGDKK